MSEFQSRGSLLRMAPCSWPASCRLGWRAIALECRALLAALVFTAALAPTAEAQYSKAGVSSFSTTSSAWTDVPGGTLSFTPSCPSDRWILLFSAVLRSSSTVDQAAEARYLVNGVEQGWGGIVNSTSNAGGAWQSFYLVPCVATAHTVQVQVRDASASGATTTIDGLRVIAWLYPAGGDVQYAAQDAPQAVPAASWTSFPSLTFTAQGLFRNYLVMATATVERADARLDDPNGGGFWPVASGPGHWVNPGLSREAYLALRAVPLPATPVTYTLQANGRPGGGIIRYARVLAIQLTNVVGIENSGTNTGFYGETTTTTTTPVAKGSANVAAGTGDVLTFQNILVRGSANVYERRAAFTRAGVVTGSYGCVLGDAGRNHDQFYASHSVFDALNSPAAFTIANTYSTSNAGFAVWAKESAPVYVRLTSASGTPTVSTNYRSIGTNGTAYTTGQATVMNGSAVVSGISGTQWLTANRGRGDYVTITGQGTYTILGVTAENSLTLTSPFTGASGTYNYSIGRKFTTIDAWRVCVEGGGGSCGVDPMVASTNLINDNRAEVGVLYNDSVFTGLGGGGNGIVYIGENHLVTTDASHNLTLTADGVNRHAGVAWNGSGAPPHVVLDGALGANKEGSVYICADYTHVEWIEVRRVRGSSAAGIKLDCNIAAGAPGIRINNVILNDNLNGILSTNAGLTPGSTMTIRNSVIQNSVSRGVHSRFAGLTTTIQNATVYGNGGEGLYQEAGTVIATNVISVSNTGEDFRSVTAANQSYNISQDAAASGGALGTGSMASHSVSDMVQGSGNWVVFEDITTSPYNLHLKTSTVNKAVDFGTSLLATAFFRNDVDNQLRPGGAAWDIGADELDGFTAVKLSGFSARGYDQAVLVEWQTASELDNLGFQLYRATSAAGPWTRLNDSRIPGLGSSPEGQRYTWPDRGLTNGAPYYYRLEDVDRSGLVTAHGPVSATPVLGAALPDAGDGPVGSEDAPQAASGPAWKAHGDPSDVALRVLRRTARGVTLELRTGGFYSQAQPDGSVRLYVPGFFDTAEAGLPALPVKRAWIDAVVGRDARVVAVQARELRSFARMQPVRAGAAEAMARPDGTYRASFRSVRAKDVSGLFPQSAARVLETAFQEQTKKAYLELAPLRFDSPRRRLVLAGRLVVKVAFDGRVEGETGTGGSKGRRRPQLRRSEPETLLARLAARAAGLHAVSWESLGASPALRQRGGQALVGASLRLSWRGQPVAFHVEPRADRFGPGSTLYFVAQGPEAAYGTETVYELAIGSGGVQMPIEPSARSVSSALVPALVATRAYEQNTNYLPALLNSRDLWFWDIGLLAPNGRDYPFTLSAPSAMAGPAHLTVELQGGSDTPKLDPDHHVRVFVNGVPVGEARWDGLNPGRFEASVDASILSDGANALRIEDLDTTGAFDSVVYLDRFTVQYPRALVAEAGRLDGRSPSSGLVRAAGLSAGALLLDVSAATPRWLTPVVSGTELGFQAEAHKSYLAVSPEAVLRPEVRPASLGTLRSGSLQADWIVIAPQELLPATEPLVAQRESQGLSARVVSLEQIQDEFGYGERQPQMIRDFLAHAYHHWAAPSPRYVLLLGDATSDPKGYLKTATRKDLLPTPLTKSTFLWTASDPTLAAVNGDDAIPDLAIGRLTAGALAEAEAAVQKILAFEEAGQSLDGNAVLVADNPDLAGDFEANANDIAALLTGRQVERIFLSERGASTRSAVLNAFDTGASLVSYVGHGSQALWASEAILRFTDVALLRPQPRQPLLLTMTCSNGYFISPFLNGLSERLVLAGDKGAIAAFSPSGLSLDAAAHLFHRALVTQLEAGGHERLGDLVLAAQKDYADTGAFPELLSIYHLFADPALKLR